MSSFAVYLVLVNLLAALCGSQQIVIATESSLLKVSGLAISGTQVLAIATAAAIALSMGVVLRSRFGRALRALQDSQDLLRACGWNILHLRTACILIGSTVGGLAGCLTALDVGIDPSMGMSGLLSALVIVVAVGPGAYSGLLPVAILLALLQQLFGYFVSPRWETAISFTVLTGFLVLRPAGLFAPRSRVEELV